MLSAVIEPKMIVIGGGLAGLTAAAQGLRNGASVLLIEKNVLGGNSMRATSGISAAVTHQQLAQHITNDSTNLFLKDIVTSGQNQTIQKLSKTLSEHSAEAIVFLETILNQPLSSIVMLGGHSVPRTHKLTSTKHDNPLPIGAISIKGLTSFIQQKRFKEKLQILEKTQVVDLHLKDSNDVVSVTGVTVKNTQDQTEKRFNAKAVVIATGGFAADLDGLVHLYRGSSASRCLYTTNGNFSQGDLLKIAQKKQLASIHLDKIQLHPTAFVHPVQTDLKEKMLCPEYIRGLGAILLNHLGQRFVNELNRRDVVSQAIIDHGSLLSEFDLPMTEEQKFHSVKVALLLMNEDIINKMGLSVYKFYKSKGLIQEFDNFSSVLQLFNQQHSETLKNTLLQYNAYATEKPDLEPFGKNAFPTLFHITDNSKYYIAYVTPAAHYTMGGIQINEAGQILRENVFDKRFNHVYNLFAAGEVVGGVHGANRLGGNGMLENIVFGRIVGRNAALISDDQSFSTELLRQKTVSTTVQTLTPLLKAQNKDVYLLRLQLSHPNQVNDLPFGTPLSYSVTFTKEKHDINKVVQGWFVLASTQELIGKIDIIITSIPPLNDLLKVQPGDSVNIQFMFEKNLINTVYVEYPLNNNTEIIAIDADTPAIGIASQFIQRNAETEHRKIVLSTTMHANQLQSFQRYLNVITPSTDIIIHELNHLPFLKRLEMYDIKKLYNEQ